MGDAKVQQSPRIISKKGGTVSRNLFDFKKLITDLIVYLFYRLVHEYNVFTISAHGPMNLSKEIKVN
jgi:hypothetical protein